MKAIYFTGFIANYSLICFLLTCGAQAQQANKEKFCYEVFEYIYSDPNRNSNQNFTLKDKSFDFLLKLTNALNPLPLDVAFIENQVVYYFWEPCAKTKKGFPQLIKDHNDKFAGKIKLVPTQDYKKEDVECLLDEKRRFTCPVGHVKFHKGQQIP